MNRISALFFSLFFLMFTNTCFASSLGAPANCTYTVENGWTQTINYKCSSDVNLNGAVIQFTVDNPSGLTNLNNVWGFINIPQYPINPTLSLTGNTASLALKFAADTVILKANTLTNFSYSTDNNVNVKSFALYPSGAVANTGTLTFSTSASSDPLPENVVIHVAGVSTPFTTSVNYPAQTTLANVPYGAYTLTATGKANGQTVSVNVTPSQVTLNDNNQKVAVSLSYTSIAATLTITLPTQQPADVTDANVLVHVVDTQGVDHPVSVSWGGSGTLNTLIPGATYKLSADSINGQSNQYQFKLAPDTLLAQVGQNKATIGVESKPLATGTATVNIIGLPANTPTSLNFTYMVNQSSKTITFTNVNNGIHSYVLPSGYTYVLSAKTIFANGLRYAANPVTFTIQTNTTTTAKLQFTGTPIQGLNGWPNYIAMGAVTDTTPNVTTSLQSRPVDAIFKYAGMGGNGDPGQIIYPIFSMQTADQAKTLTNYYKQHNINNSVKPVMVIYTAEMSGGTSFKDFEFEILTKHYITLIMETQKLQSYQTPDNPYPASVVLNPDLLGMVQQLNLIPALNDTISKVDMQKALKIAVCFVTHTITTQFGANLNYEQLFQAIRAETTDNWSAMSTWDEYKMQYYNDCTAKPVVPSNITIPTFTHDFPGWSQSTNWIIRQFAPNVTFGWQENLWAIGSSNWVHTNYVPADLKSKIVDPTLATINASYTYGGTYRPDFISFDKYEMETIPAAVAIGYLFNARDWLNVLAFVKGISEGLGTVPAMLWQIPGSHLQQKNDIDQRENRASTEPDYFFGNEVNPLPNLKPYIVNTPLPVGIYGYSEMVTYLSMGGLGNIGAYTWQKSHMQAASDSHVFAILWGGGNTTSVSVFPSDDSGWLAGKIIEYYKNPTPTFEATMLKQNQKRMMLKSHRHRQH